VSVDVPVLLYLAPIGAGLVLLLGLFARRRRVRAALRWSPELGAVAGRSGRLGAPLAALAGLLAMAGASGPRWGGTEVATESRALNLIIAIDISRSMLAEDAAPSRLERAVRESRRLLQDARGDRVALLAFAGRSYILAPLTLDDAAVRLQLDALDPGIASEGGTELTSVLRQAGQVLDAASEGGARALVLFTDGEAHDSIGAALDAARALGRAGVTLIVVGEGGTSPTRIPLRDPAGAVVEYKKDATGAEVFTARRDEVLRGLADAAQGVLVPADVADQAGAAWKTLAGLERSPASGRRAEDQTPRAWLFGLAGALLLAGQAMARRSPSLLAIAGLLAPIGAIAAQRPAAGHRDLARGDTARAVARYLEAARGGRGGDTAWYNAGTLALGDPASDIARDGLTAASGSLDPSLRFQALYNLGVASLRRARAGGTATEQHERDAARWFREALLLAPSSVEAKWNLELVSRRIPPSAASSAPRSAPTRRPDPGSGEGPGPTRSGLSRSEAERILASVERAEHTVRAEQTRRRRVAGSAAAKDW
jgi:Ca-activated chloride channel family protein